MTTNESLRWSEAAFQKLVPSLLQGYVCVGTSATAQLRAGRAGGGIDLVWDLWNEQFSAFYYGEGAFAPLTTVSAEASGSIHLSFGTGTFKDIHAAWSGIVASRQVTISADFWRFLSIGGSVQYFQSPDHRMRGGAVAVSLSAATPSLSEALRLPLGVDVSVARGKWYPFDAATQMFVRSGRVIRLTSSGTSHVAVELSGSKVPTHMLSVLGANPLLLSLAAYAALVCAVKAYMRERQLGDADRERAFAELQRWVFSHTFRLVHQYERQRASGQIQIDGYTIEKTPQQRFLICATIGGEQGAIGDWSTLMWLYDANGRPWPDAPLLVYRMATRGAANGFILGRSYPLEQLSQLIAEHRRLLMRY